MITLIQTVLYNMYCSWNPKSWGVMAPVPPRFLRVCVCSVSNEFLNMPEWMNKIILYLPKLYLNTITRNN